MYDSDIEDDALAFWLGCFSLVLIILGAAAICAFVWWVGALVGWW